MAQYAIAMQHAHDGYSRCGNFGGSLVFLFARWHQCLWFKNNSLRAQGRCRGLKVVKLCSSGAEGTSYSLVQILLLQDLTTMHSVTDGRTDRQTRLSCQWNYQWQFALMIVQDKADNCTYLGEFTAGVSKHVNLTHIHQ